MEFLPDQVGNRLLTWIKESQEVWIAVAYFTPSAFTLAALRAVPVLHIVVSDEFDINNPHKLRTLETRGNVRVVPTDSPAGKLHAKVVVGKRDDGSRWMLVGSANLTHGGLFANREATMAIDSRRAGDVALVTEAREWIEKLHSTARAPDWDVAIETFRRSGRPRPGIERDQVAPKARSFWVMKTTAGPHGPTKWPEFKAEGVVAIGWYAGRRDLSSMTVPEIRAVIASERGGGPRVAKKMSDFAHEVKKGDRVVICRGYPANSQADVHVYGVGVVSGPYFLDRESTWWYHKIPVALELVEDAVPKGSVVDALNKGSLMETIHRISQAEFGAFRNMLRDEVGAVIRVEP